MRAQQFKKRDARFRELITRTIQLRHKNKDYFNNTKAIRNKPLWKGDLVLVRDSFGDVDRSVLTKFAPK